MEKSYDGLARGIRSTPEDDEVASLDRERIEDGSARGTALKVGFSLTTVLCSTKGICSLQEKERRF
jgi:hypothetical protein